MPRSGISYFEVAKHCDALAAQNIKPTVDRLRELLGTGSRTTINELKKQWEAKSQQLHTNPKGVSESISLLVSQLSQQLTEEAEEINRKNNEKHQKEIDNKNEQLDEVARRLESAQSRLDQLKQTHKELKTKHSNIEKQLSDEVEKRSTAEASAAAKDQLLVTLENHNASLEQKHDQARLALDHYRNSAREQMEHERQRFEEALAKHAHDYRQLQDQVSDKNNQISTLNHQNGILVTEKKDLTQKLHDSSLLTTALTAKQAALEAKNSEKNEKIEVLSDKLLVTVEAKSELEANNKILNNENHHLKDLINEMRDKLKLLEKDNKENEKLISALKNKDKKKE